MPRSLQTAAIRSASRSPARACQQSSNCCCWSESVELLALVGSAPGCGGSPRLPGRGRAAARSGCGPARRGLPCTRCRRGRGWPGRRGSGAGRRTGSLWARSGRVAGRCTGRAGRLSSSIFARRSMPSSADLAARVRRRARGARARRARSWPAARRRATVLTSNSTGDWVERERWMLDMLGPFVRELVSGAAWVSAVGRGARRRCRRRCGRAPARGR